MGGHQFHKWIQQYGCYRSDPPRRRRRSGKGQGRERRRRRTRQTCRQRRVENCDTYCRWYVYLKVMSFLRAGYEQWEWKIKDDRRILDGRHGQARRVGLGRSEVEVAENRHVLVLPQVQPKVNMRLARYSPALSEPN